MKKQSSHTPKRQPAACCAFFWTGTKDCARIEDDKDKLLKNFYAWILDDASFQPMEDAGRVAAALD